MTTSPAELYTPLPKDYTASKAARVFAMREYLAIEEMCRVQAEEEFHSRNPGHRQYSQLSAIGQRLRNRTDDLIRGVLALRAGQLAGPE